MGNDYNNSAHLFSALKFKSVKMFIFKMYCTRNTNHFPSLINFY